MSKAYAKILSAVYGQPWAVQPGKLEAITGFLELKAAGEMADVEVRDGIHAEAEVMAARKASSAARGGMVAVLPLYGLIMQRGNMVADVSGPSGTSVEGFKAQFRQAMSDPNVKAIVIDVDSPGGAVSGVDELASEIRAARGKGKKITAVANCLCASAAYYIACSADEIVASPSSQTGSIGVFGALRDESAAMEKAGVKVHLVAYGENKALGDPRVPTAPAAISELQKMVDAFGRMFDKAVAQGRNITQARVREAFGQGLTFTAAEAKAIGMVDRIATLDDVLAEYGVGSSSARAQMEAGAPELQAEAEPAAVDMVRAAHEARQRGLALAEAGV